MVRNIFIMSAGRSGSTMLNLMLGAHPGATAVGEITHLPKNLALDTQCSCGQPVRVCSFWKQVVAQLSESLSLDIAGNPYSLELGAISASRVIDHAQQTAGYVRAWKLRHGAVYANLRYGIPVPAAIRGRFDAGVKNTLALYEAVRAVSGAPIVVDASKTYLKGLGICGTAPADTRLIFLIRDGRASFFSRLRDGMNRDKALRAWCDYYERAMPLMRRNVRETNIASVRYEDLAQDPESTLRILCNRLGFAFSEEMLHYRTKVQHITNGNDMRMRTDNVVRLDTRWQTEMSDADLGYFESVAGELNRELGYR